MNTTKTVYALGLALILGLLAWGLTFLSKEPQQAPSTPEQHILAGSATSTGSLEYAENHPYYTVDLVYPDTGIQSEQTAIEQALKQELDDYVQSVADADPSLMPSLGQGYKLALSVDYKKFAGAGGTSSYLFTYYEDTGGAHPNHFFKTFVFSQSGAQLALSDLFVSSSTNTHADYLNQIAGIATPDIEGQIAQRLGGDATSAIFSDGLTPTTDNYSDWVLDGSTLKFFFPPYQVAAYAAGDFEVDIPLSKLAGILKPSYK
jgi:hypothetical protein